MPQNPKGSIAAEKPNATCCQDMRKTTMFTVLAGVVQQCRCGVVHSVQHKTVVETPISFVHDPQVTFDEWFEEQVRNAMQDLEVSTYDLDADPNDNPDAGF